MAYLRQRHKIAGESTALNLVLIFVLAGLATTLFLPVYRNYTLREHAKLAKAALEQLQVQGQAWQHQHPAQRWTFDDLGYAGQALYVSSDGTLLDSASISSIYRISIAAAATPESCGLAVDDPQTGQVMAAEPIQTQRIETHCGRLCLSSAGVKGAAGADGADACWDVRHP